MMNLQLRKELVGLRWAWGIALLAALFPVLPWPHAWSGFASAGLWAWLFFLGCVVLGMEVLGHEFNGRSFGLLLTQPVARPTLWKRKMLVLGLAAGTVLGLFLVASLRAVDGLTQMPAPGTWILVSGALLVAGVGFALWFSLQIRQTAAVFWLALLLPTSLYGLVGLIVERVSGRYGWATPGLVVLAVLGGLAWWAAYRSFLRAEDLPPLGRELHLPRLGRRAHGVEGPGRALWRKELRLHQLPAVVTLMAAMMLLAVLLAHWLAPSQSSGVFLLLVLWSWLLLPLLVGACALAEERRLGMATAWRMLPVSRARQWWTKVAAALAVALVLGAVLPLVLNLAAWWVLRDTVRIIPVFPWWAWGLSWFLGATVGLYASSLTRNLVQALTVAVVVVGVAVGGLMLAAWMHGGDDRVVALGLALGAACWLPMLWWLAQSNAAWVQVDRRLIRRNAVVVSGMVLAVGLVTIGSYARAWEIVTGEPPAKQPLPVLPDVRPVIEAHSWAVSGHFLKARSEALGFGAIAVLAPDGRLWLCGPFGLADRPRPGQARALDSNRRYHSMGATERRVYAVDTEGSLWVWDWSGAWLVIRDGQVGLNNPRFWDGVGRFVPNRQTEAVEGAGAARRDTEPHRGQPLDRHGASDVPGDWLSAQRVGIEGEWEVVSAHSSHAVALKRDGSLWGFGANSLGQLGHAAFGFRTEPTAPIQLGAGRGWRLAAAGHESTLAVDLEGEVWRWGFSLEGEVWRWGFSSGWLELPRAARQADFGKPYRVAGSNDWVHLHTRLSSYYALGELADGSLWAFDPHLAPWDSEQHMRAPVRVAAPVEQVMWQTLPTRARLTSRRTDWVAFSPQGVALTADGVVWSVPEDASRWLGPSRWMQPLLTLRLDTKE